MTPMQLTTTFPTEVTTRDFYPLITPSPVYTYLRQVMGMNHADAITTQHNIWYHMYGTDKLRLTSLQWQHPDKRDYVRYVLTTADGGTIPWSAAVTQSLMDERVSL